MEYTALLAGKPFSDSPDCVDSQITAFMIWCNDNLTNFDRQVLVPLLGRGIGLVKPRKPRPYPQRQLQLDPTLATKYANRVLAWEDKAKQFRQREVEPRVAAEVSEFVARYDDLSANCIATYSGWSNATGNRMAEPDEDGCAECGWGPDDGRCEHVNNPGHLAAVAFVVRLAEALHTAYEKAMEARGWKIKREIACDLPQVMAKIG